MHRVGAGLVADKAAAAEGHRLGWAADKWRGPPAAVVGRHEEIEGSTGDVQAGTVSGACSAGGMPQADERANAGRRQASERDEDPALPVKAPYVFTAVISVWSGSSYEASQICFPGGKEG